MKYDSLEPFKKTPAEIIERLSSLLHDAMHGAALMDSFKDQYREAQSDARKYTLLQERGSGYVYALIADIPGAPLVKIGMTEHLSERLNTLGIQIPFKVRVGMAIIVQDARAVESALHRQFKQYRHNGEWFYVPGVTDVCVAMCQQFGVVHFFDPEIMGASVNDVFGDPSDPLDFSDARISLVNASRLLERELSRLFSRGIPGDVAAIFNPVFEFTAKKHEELCADLGAVEDISFGKDEDTPQ